MSKSTIRKLSTFISSQTSKSQLQEQTKIEHLLLSISQPFMQPPNHSEPAYAFPGYFPAGGESRIFPAFYDRFGRGAKPWTLPHPDEIRKNQKHACSQTPTPGGLTTATTTFTDKTTKSSGSNHFTSTDASILVKWGPNVSVSEAIALLTVDAYVGRACPVPTVYGWFIESSASPLNSDETNDHEFENPSPCTFLYISHVSGPTLAERYPTLTAGEKGYIARQLKKAIGALRSLRPAEGVAAVVGTLEKKGVGDRLLREVFAGQEKKESGQMNVFDGITEFHNFIAGERLWNVKAPVVKMSTEKKEWKQKRQQLRDDQPVGFCHADFTMKNIILTGKGEGPVRVKAVVGWEGAGFYPVAWEGWKARLNGNWDKLMFEEGFGGLDQRLDSVWEGYDFFLDLARERNKAVEN